jgi:DNA primase
MRPELARELPNDWLGEGPEGAAIAALADWLRESADETSTAAMIQQFQGTIYEATFAQAQGEVMQWGEDFDVAAEFKGVLQKLQLEAVDSEIAFLEARGLAMGEQERKRYEQLVGERNQLKAQRAEKTSSGT